MALVDSLIVFVVNLLIGALGIYVGGRVIVDADDYGGAVVTAALGALVWAAVSFFVGWVPLLGPVLALVAYVAVIDARYPGGWLDAAGIAVVAWLAALAILWVLGFLGVVTVSATGVPGA